MNRQLLRESIKLGEGLRLKPYTDTVGKLSIGYGRNLTDVGITALEAESMLDHDIAQAVDDVRRAFPWVERLDDVRQRVVCEMCFNLGLPKLQGFVRTLGALERGDYAAAAAGMLGSRWAQQVKGRAVRLARMMETGRDA